MGSLPDGFFEIGIDFGWGPRKYVRLQHWTASTRPQNIEHRMHIPVTDLGWWAGTRGIVLARQTCRSRNRSTAG